MLSPRLQWWITLLWCLACTADAADLARFNEICQRPTEAQREELRAFNFDPGVANTSEQCLSYFNQLQERFKSHKNGAFILAALSNFDVLSVFDELEVVDISIKDGKYPLDFAPLTKLSRLSSLRITRHSVLKDELGNYLYPKFANIDKLGTLSHLHSLHLENFGFKDISFIAPMTKLRILRLPGNEITDAGVIRHFTDLEELDLSLNPIRDISPLEPLVKLKKLELRITRVNDVSALKSMTLLTELTVVKSMPREFALVLGLDARELTDITPLAHLVNLKELDLSDQSIVSVDALKNLTALERLHLSENAIQDVSPLSHLKNLKFLRLSHNKIKNSEVLRPLMKYNPDISITLYNNPLRSCQPQTEEELAQGKQCRAWQFW